MATPFYVTVEGKLQGKFKCSSTDVHHEGAIVGLAFSYELTVPRDSAGQAPGDVEDVSFVFARIGITNGDITADDDIAPGV